MERSWYGYDARGRNLWVSHRTFNGAVETEVQRVEQTYDPAGNVSTRFQALFGYGSQTTTNTYDRANRLKSEVRVADQYSPAGSGYSQSYSYDKAGNRTSVTRNGNSYGYSYGLWNRLSTAEGYTLSNYDGDGNPLTVIVPGQGTWSCLYDEEGRITTQTGPKGITYSYDADGRRVTMTVSGLTTKYVYDGSTMIMEVGPSYDSYHLPGVTFVANGTQYLDRYDQLGSSLATVSQISALQSAREYDAYGREFEYKTGPRSVYRFAGKHGYVSDWDTKMLLLGARYYIPQLGRFLTQDPIGQAGGLNLYNYCDNNPLAKVDPDGKHGVDLDSIRATISQAMFQASTHPREAADMLRTLLASGGLTAQMTRVVQNRLQDVNWQRGLMQTHHYLPRQFEKFFSKAGLNINEYTRSINAEWHRLVHGKLMRDGVDLGGYKREALFNYNQEWAIWIRANGDASRQQILQQAAEMATKYRLPSIPFR